MKMLRSAVVVITAATIIACMSGVSFAFEKGQCKDCQEKCQAAIKDLKDSAAALQQTNPDLAKGLNDLAAQKEKKIQEMTDMKAKHETKTKMLRDSAAALQKTNPDLAKKLWDMSEYKSMKKGWKEKKEHMGMVKHEEAHEAGE